MTKKILIILLTLCLVFSLAACSSDMPKNDTPDNVPIDETETEKQTNTETEKETNTETQTDDSGATDSKAETHSHSYSKATCLEPAKCSCGATKGEKGSHSYSNGVCTVCGAKNYLNPTNSLKTYAEYIGNLHVSGEMLIGGALQFENDVCVVTERYFNSQQTDPNQTPIVFKGTNYYSEGGGQNPHYYELTDSEIIIKGSFWGSNADGVTIKLILQSNGLLKVTHSTNSLLPVGTVLSTNINDVLK